MYKHSQTSKWVHPKISAKWRKIKSPEGATCSRWPLIDWTSWPYGYLFSEWIPNRTSLTDHFIKWVGFLIVSSNEQRFGDCYAEIEAFFSVIPVACLELILFEVNVKYRTCKSFHLPKSDLSQQWLHLHTLWSTLANNAIVVAAILKLFTTLKARSDHENLASFHNFSLRHHLLFARLRNSLWVKIFGTQNRKSYRKPNANVEWDWCKKKEKPSSTRNFTRTATKVASRLHCETLHYVTR